MIDVESLMNDAPIIYVRDGIVDIIMFNYSVMTRL